MSPPLNLDGHRSGAEPASFAFAMAHVHVCGAPRRPISSHRAQGVAPHACMDHVAPTHWFLLPHLSLQTCPEQHRSLGTSAWRCSSRSGIEA